MKDGVVYTDSVKTAGKTADVKVEKVLAANSDEDIELYMRSQVLTEREGSTLQPLKRYLSKLREVRLACSLRRMARSSFPLKLSNKERIYLSD